MNPSADAARAILRYMPPEQPPYEIIEHTADAGLVAHGGTQAEAFANIARGMYNLMTDPDLVEERVTREIVIDAPNEARLLERWLEELLFVTDVDGLLFRDFDVSIEGTTLRATARGEPIDPERHELRGDIKGVTRHMTAVEARDGGYCVRVLLDV
jgi:SHS2 domain-containing protein